MFIGHFGLGFGAKKAAPAVSLGTLFIACQFADLLWPTLVLLGIERVEIQPGATAMTPLDFVSYPWSHSLEALCLWGVVFGGAYVAVRRARISAAVTLALLVVSHWVLDFFTHAPDMPLWPGPSPRFGLGLWNSIPGTLLVEGALWTAAIAIYLRASRPRPIAFWSLVIVSTVIWATGPWSPPPPNERALGWFALIGWIIIPWAAFADGPMK